MKIARGVFLTLLLSVAAEARVRVLLPSVSAALPIAHELAALVQEYNDQHLGPPGSEVVLMRRGEGFSALRELMALSLAGDAPDLAGIEPHENVALGTSPYRAARIIPFERSLPVLVWNPALLKGEGVRDYKDRKDLLATPLLDLSGGLKIALPFQGVRGLWLLEAWAAKPLWKRELGGLRSNRELASILEELRASPKVVIDNWENSVQSFVDGKAPALLISTDILPLIQAQARFKWRVSVFPHASPLMTGTDLLVLRESPEVAAFLKYLFSPPVAARWTAAGGYWPLSPAITREKAWKNKPGLYTRFVQDAALRLPPGPLPRRRTTDPQVIRATTEWITALRVFFKPESSLAPGESRPSAERVFDQLDATLGTQSTP